YRRSTGVPISYSTSHSSRATLSRRDEATGGFAIIEIEPVRVGDLTESRSATAPNAAPPRLISLDVFRGLTVAGMVLVNNPGTGSAIYAPLRHADWHGLTPTDLIFPFFLFIVGVAIPLALGRRVDQGQPRGSLVARILRRSAIIFALGLLLNAWPGLDP